jgi:hypothetical protein
VYPSPTQRTHQSTDANNHDVRTSLVGDEVTIELDIELARRK